MEEGTTNPFIVSRTENPEERLTELVLKNGTWLGNALLYLPHGIINKTVTGIGATTLELKSPRNSIIVEPLKMIASSKTSENKQMLYVGSETDSHSATTREKIKNYLNDTGVKYKKIVVVADSLPKVMDVIGKSGIKDYFLMIDEVDSFQTDSTFRNSMERCLDVYKEFPQDQRALVSATHLRYSDPELHSEHTTIIKYKDPEPRKIKLIHTDNVPGTAADLLREVLRDYPEDKIVVAYNIVGGCYGLAKHLVDNVGLPEEAVKILCSLNSQSKAGTFFGTLRKGNLLPGKVTFLTSAYFTGVDINEPYHLISLSNPEQSVSVLSDHRLKQIAGRCRPGLVSESIVYGTKAPSKNETATEKELIRAAEYELKALDCLKMHFREHPILADNLMKVRQLVVESTQHLSHALVRLRADQEPAISYFNIDASIETARVAREIYSAPKALKDALEKEKNDITFEEKRSTLSISEQPKADPRERERIVETAIKNLEEHDDYLSAVDVLFRGDIPPLELEIYKEYDSLSEYVEKKQLLKRLQDCYLPEKGVREWRRFKRAAMFAALPDDHMLKRNIQHHFRPGDLLSPEVIKDRLETVFRESSMPLTFSSHQRAVSELGNYVVTDRKQKKRKGVYHIGGLNPKQVEVKSHIRETPATFADLFAKHFKS